MKSIEKIIEKSKDSREVKRALAVKMSQERVKHQNIARYLQVSASYISKWVMIYEKQGAHGLLLNYQGKVGYLTEEEKQEVVLYLKQQNTFSVEQLRDYLENQYQVVYKSKQSYYNLLEEGGLSWKKTQKKNPKRNEEVVVKTRKSIQRKIRRTSQALAFGNLKVLIIDECHLRWGNVCGYVWGQKQQSISVPIINERTRQTYYGAIDCQTRTFQLQAYPSGDSYSTIEFIEYLRNLYPNHQLILVWDGASYHHSLEVKQYLAKLNKGLRRIRDWKVRCLRLAPYAPDQNPVEDIWLQGKNFLRRHFYLNKTFAQVKKSFFDFLANRTFYFDKLSIYS